METSILKSIKKLLGIPADVTQFDADLMTHINSVFATLTQLGVGPPNGFIIDDDLDAWNQFITDFSKWSFIKSYVYLKVKLLFDPPINASVIESINRQISELEWRIYMEANNDNNSVEKED